MNEPPPPVEILRHVAVGREGVEIKDDERYQIDDEYGHDAGHFLGADRRSDHIVGKHEHDDHDAGSCPPRCLDIFSALIDEPHSKGVAAAVLDEDENCSDDGYDRAKYIEEQFGGSDPCDLDAKFFRKEPVDRSHEAHKKPDDERVDMEDFGNIEIKQPEKEIRVNVIVRRHQPSDGHDAEQRNSRRQDI